MPVKESAHCGSAGSSFHGCFFVSFHFHWVNFYVLTDTQVILYVLTDTQLMHLCLIVGKPELLKSERFFKQVHIALYVCRRKKVSGLKNLSV